MWRAAFDLLKTIILVGIAVLLAAQQGEVQVAWRDYTMTIHLGIVLFLLFVLVLAVAAATGLLHRIGLWPSAFRRHRLERRREKGYQAIMRSLTAAAAGDHKHAYYHAYRAEKFLPESQKSLSVLLQANAAARRGQDDTAGTAYRALLNDRETSFLGVQGLVEGSVKQGDTIQALILARAALERDPKRAALRASVYDLEIANRLWNDALQSLKKIDRTDPRQRDRKVIYLILAEQAEKEKRADETLRALTAAHDIDPFFVPSVVRLARHRIARGEMLKARGIVKKAWIKTGHDDLAPLWSDLTPPLKNPSPSRADDALNRYRWFVWVSNLNRDSAAGLMALAEAAAGAGLWGEAREALAMAEKKRATKSLYKRWAAIEEKSGATFSAVLERREKSLAANADPVWTCAKTGREFPNWVAIVEPEGHINTLFWR